MILKPKSDAIPPAASSPRGARAERNASEKLKYTQHIQLGDFGESLDGSLYQDVTFEYEGQIRRHTLPLAGLTPTSVEFHALTNDGAHLVSQAARAELISRMQSCAPSTPKLRVATRLGFIGNTFVLPGHKIGPDKESVRTCLPAGRSERLRYRVGGSLKQWQRLAKLAIGNTRLMLLIAAAFSGSVAALLNLEQIGLLLAGPPEAGKSTIAVAAGSVFGCATDPNMAARLGFVLPFNATDNDIEDELLAANHTLLAIDETRSTGRNDKEIGEYVIALVMRLESGFEKGRSNSNTTRQSAAAPFIMTSNLSLGRLGAAAGRTDIDDALHGRLITIPAPANAHGMFEDLHGKEDVVALIGLIRHRATRYFGHASRSFLEALVQANADDPDALREWLGDRRKYYLKHAHEISAPGRHMNRIHERMATVFAAARFAIEHNVLPWAPRDLGKSLLACTRDHVELVASEASLVVAPTRGRLPVNVPLEREQQLLDQLREHVRANREKIIDLSVRGAADGLATDPLEWPILKNIHRKSGVEYLFTEDKLLSIFGNKSRVQALKDALKSDGHIATEGSDGNARCSVKRTIPGRKGRAQVVAIYAAAIDENS